MHKPSPNVRPLVILVLVIVSLLINACQSSSSKQNSRYHLANDSAPSENVDVSHIPNAVPKAEPKSRYGNPESYEVFGKTYYTLPSSKGYQKTGIASWYGSKFHGYRTSSGEPYDMLAMTAASTSLPLPTYVKVENLNNGREVIVKVNDRGPFHENRIIDLSYAAAKKLGITAKGTGLVKVTALDPGNYQQNLVDIKHTTKPSHQPEIFIQAGAFSNKDYAEQLSSKVKALITNPVNIKTVQRDNKPLYKVQIGPIANVDITDHVFNRLEGAGLGKPITVIE